MGVSFPLMLRLALVVRFVVVFHGRVIVLVGMGGRHVLPLAAMPQVMHHVSMVVGVNDGVMGVLHSDLLVTVLRREPAGRPRLGGGSAGAAGTRPPEAGPAVGTCARHGPGFVPGGDDLASNWPGRGSRSGRVVDREGERISL